MKSGYVIIKLNTFEIVDADKTLYAYVGRREYWPFDRLVMDAYVDQFYRFLRRFQLGEGHSTKFFIRLIDEIGGNKPFVCWFSSATAEDKIKLNLIEVESLIDENQSLLLSLENAEAILSLYNDTYFIFDPNTELFTFYSMVKNKQRLFTKTAEEMLQQFVGALEAEDYGDFINFINGLKKGIHHQEAFFPFDINNPEDNSKASYIQSIAIFEDGKYNRSCGYLHRGLVGSLNFGKMVELDSLTGVMNKTEITAKAINLIDMHKTNDTTICIIDVDFFKRVNDNFGHMKGDEVLRRVAGIIEEAVGNDGMVGRIGGDEFMVIFHNVYDMEDMREVLKSIKNHVNSEFPPGRESEPEVSLSIGCASFPKDADNYAETFLLADFALYRAKEKGRDRYIIYDIAKHGGLEVAKNMNHADRIEGRGDYSKGDILCAMMDKVFGPEEYPIQKLLDDFIVNFDIQRIMIYSGTPMKIKFMAGEGQLDYQTRINTEDYVNTEEYQALYENGNELIRNNVAALENQHNGIYKKMVRQNVEGFIHFKIKDCAGNDCVLSLDAVKRISWNKNNFYYYRLFARMISSYDLSAEEDFV